MTEDAKPSKSYPTPFQRKTVWTGLTAFFLVVIFAFAIGMVWLFMWTMGILQPVLVPLAVAGVLAYLLYPLVDKLIDRDVPQKKASLVIFAGFMVASSLLILAIALPLSKQAGQLVRDFPAYIKKFEQTLDKSSDTLRTEYSDHLLLGPIVQWLPEIKTDDAGDANNADDAVAEGGKSETDSAVPETQSPPGPAVEPVVDPDTTVAESAPPTEPAIDDEMPSLEPGALRSWLLEQLPVIGGKVWAFVRNSVGGFLGAFGFVIGFFLVPIYLFFFLREAPHIRDTWSDYIPIRASRFKDEVVGTLTDINGYLVAFFRGQMLVSLIDGLITAVLLTVLGLKFGLLIGVLVGILGIIPYLGIIMCFIPAVIIATVQGASHDWYMSHDAAWWVLPLVVTIVFVAVNNLDGIFIAPKIVGDSVGLHPFTIIFSVLFWSLLLGGLLGALLAVPLTASLKVLFVRYIWERRVKPIAAESAAPPVPGPAPDAPAP